MTEVTLTELRTRLFELADATLASGRPVEIRRNGQKLLLTRATDAAPRDRLLAYLEVGQTVDSQPMNDEDRKMFDLSDVLEMHDPNQPELYD